jgi:hypothetical protein
MTTFDEFYAVAWSHGYEAARNDAWKAVLRTPGTVNATALDAIAGLSSAAAVARLAKPKHKAEGRS